MHVSLAEALEVRGGPLQEEEVWAVLSQSADSLQELFHKGMKMWEPSVQRCLIQFILIVILVLVLNKVLSFQVYCQVNHRPIHQITA